MSALMGYTADRARSRLARSLAFAWRCCCVGGLVFSQLITLYLTPAVYIYLESLQQWVGKYVHTGRIIVDEVDREEAELTATLRGGHHIR